ncbi:FkbM family methyltransferase [Ruegeria arenilitoris]|uniref:FkbM family methyltransferase n=1 Tax=Ruegeria arenilitoris TaxID=1173585 RepID=UPI001C2BC1AF
MDHLGEAAQRALAKAAQLAGRGPVRRLIRAALPPSQIRYEGLVFNIDPAQNYTDFFLWMNGHPKERKSLALISAAVAGQRVCFLDIGANMGLYSICVAQQAGIGSQVLAFEPNPAMAERLQANIVANTELSAGIEIVDRAIGAEAGQASLQIPHNAGEASLRYTGDGETSAVDVQVAPLSNYLPGPEVRWDKVVLKVDIEGFEDAALHSLLSCPSARLPDAILLEITHRDRWTTDIIEALLAHGYAETHRLEGNAFLQRGA